MRLSLVVLMLLVGVARADVHKSNAGKVSIDIPKKWTVDAKDDLLRAQPPDGAVGLALFVVDSADVKAALARLEGELYSSVQGLKWVNNPKQVNVNRMKATFVEGVGVSGGATQLDVLVMVAGPTPTKKGVIVMAAVEHAKLAAQKKAIYAIFQSLRPTK